MKMEQQEKKIIADIKKMAKDNQMVGIQFCNIHDILKKNYFYFFYCLSI